MKPEIEAVFLDINKDDLRDKLRAAGGKMLQAEVLMQRVIFDLGDRAYARVRDEGNKVTMTWKRVDDLSLSGVKEVNVEVNDYDKAVEFLQAIGLKPKAEQETYREEWRLGEVEIDIDTWPWLPTYVEIEGPSEAAVKDAAEKLGFRMEDAHYGCVDEIYKLYYDVTSDDINYCSKISFVPVPDWLEKKRKK